MRALFMDKLPDELSGAFSARPDIVKNSRHDGAPALRSGAAVAHPGGPTKLLCPDAIPVVVAR